MLRRLPRVVVAVAALLAPLVAFFGSSAQAYAFAVAPVAPLTLPSSGFLSILNGTPQAADSASVAALTDAGSGGVGDIIGYGGAGGGSFGIGATAAETTTACGAAAVGVAICGFAVGYLAGTMLVQGYKWAFGPSYPQPNFDEIISGGAAKCWVTGAYGGTSVACSATLPTAVGLYREGVTLDHFGTPVVATGAVAGTVTNHSSGCSAYFGGATSGTWHWWVSWYDKHAVVQTTTIATGSVDCTAALSDSVGTGVAGVPMTPFDASQTSTDPSRQLVATAHCVSLSAGLETDRSATSATFTEDGTLPAVPNVSCQSGEFIDEVVVTETGTGMPTKTLYTFKPDPSWDAIIEAYPLCAQSACLLVLYKNVAGTWLSCNAGSATCVGWWDDPAVASDYQCKWGTYVMPISECESYKDAWPASGTSVVTTPSGSQPGSGTSAVPQTGANPATGDGTSSDDCVGSGWSWNPVSWVYVPVKCALLWAFDPGPTYLSDQITSLQTAWDGSTPGQALDVVSNFGHAFTDAASGTGADCAGPGFDVGHVWGVGDNTYLYQPLYACDGFGKTVHDFAQPFVLAAMWAAALWTSWNYLARSFGMAQQ